MNENETQNKTRRQFHLSGSPISEERVQDATTAPPPTRRISLVARGDLSEGLINDPL